MAILEVAQACQKALLPHINHDGSLRPEAFRALLKLKGVNISALAELHGVESATLHHVINREYRNAVAENAIADALGLESISDLIWGRK